MIQRKDGKISLPGLEKHTGELFPFNLSYDKPCGKLALGQNCVKIISDKSNSVAMFLQILTDIYKYTTNIHIFFVEAGIWTCHEMLIKPNAYRNQRKSKKAKS